MSKPSHIDQLYALILNHQQMEQELHDLEQQGVRQPYFFSLTQHNQHFYYIGGRHSYDPAHPQNGVIQARWAAFSQATQTYDRIALIEGGVRPSMSTILEAITKGGEAGLVTHLAHQDGVEVQSPEPSYKEQFDHLLQHFSQDEIAYYYFARIAWQWHRLRTKPEFEEYIDHFANRYYRHAGWGDYDFSLEHMIQIHDRTHDHPFDLHDVECYKISSNPAKSPVPDACSTFRDQTIVKNIYELWQLGKSIFIVYGSGHWVTQKPALEAMHR